jgi:phage shock protein PspC (stress-responsive transcriptional regulator)
MPSEGEFGFEGPAPKALPEDTSDVGIGEDGMPLNPSDPHAVQFIPSSNPKNGDAKVELGEVGGVPKFVGLGKEELMKYANDPFWVRLRWILFILFWLLWVAMLAGAIVIIVLAPKCSGKVADEVVADGPYYQVYLKSFSSNADKLAGKAYEQEIDRYWCQIGI